MKPIKSVGKVRPEVKINSKKERSSAAYKMAVEGTTSTPDYIAMVDSKVKSGKWDDHLGKMIKSEIRHFFGGQCQYTFNDFVSALAASVTDVALDDIFQLEFNAAKGSFDLLRQEAMKLQSVISNSPSADLCKSDMVILHEVLRDVEKDNSRAVLLTKEVDKAMELIRGKVMKRLGLRRTMKVNPLFDINPIEVESGESNPGDFHIDKEKLEATLAAARKSGCSCGGKCHSKRSR